jgi:K+-transporting ATPase ATPase A chain
MGNFYVDLWRGTAYIFVPLCLVVGVLLMGSGVPMTLKGHVNATTVEPGAMGTDSDGHPTMIQQIARGPVAAIVAAKQFGTNGGGYFGAVRDVDEHGPAGFRTEIDPQSIVLHNLPPSRTQQYDFSMLSVC